MTHGPTDVEFEDQTILAIAGGRKDDSGKERFDLLPPELLFGVSEVLTYGAAKYAPRNWERGMSWGRVFGALMRHMWAWWRGERIDAESGLPHLAHAGCCVAFLMAYEARRIGADDRLVLVPASNPAAKDWGLSEQSQATVNAIKRNHAADEGLPFNRHIATSHVLCVQWDGYVLDPARWEPAFLEYDYIGALWPHFGDAMRVGNGGFSLRSRRLLEACATLDIGNEAEDVAICRTHRPALEQRFGLRFAPEDVARHFAFERAAPQGDEFGFHGAFNMVARIPSADLANVLAGLEPGVLNRREHREMLGRALRRGDLRLAWIIWQRLRHPAARRR